MADVGGFYDDRYFKRRKRAVKSKPPQGIAIKKRRNWISEEDEERVAGSKKSRSASVRKIEGLIPVAVGCIEDYERVKGIGSGSYGAVYIARHVKSGEIVAVKKELQGLSKSTMAEIKIMSGLDHPSVVGFKEVAVDDWGGVYVVMEYADQDLEEYIHKTSFPRVKCLMKELLEGVEYLHQGCGLIHRDLKPSNILIDHGGKLKICDFGMSRKIPTASDPPPTTNVATLWYKAPELLLGEPMYSAAIDMWAVGCPSDCLQQMFDEATALRGGPLLTHAGFHLLSQLLALDPQDRLTAGDALNHPWFHES